jgi:Zn-dependent metalloprotease
VVGHELTHGVTQCTAGLSYKGQSGALNQSMSDVFGSLVKQMAAGQTPDKADWLIGAGLFMPNVSGAALRSTIRNSGRIHNPPISQIIWTPLTTVAVCASILAFQTMLFS